jgi:outer membrane protein assembly factor BamB
MRTTLGKCLTVVVFLTAEAGLAAPASGPAAAGPQAKEVLAKIAVPKGMCVVLGLPEAGQAGFVTDLAAGSEMTVYFQSPDRAEEAAVRKAAQAAGLLGKRVFADRGPWRQIHLADNLAGLVWLSPAAGQQVPPEEVLRVLHPEGKALFGQKEIVKPLPPGADAWSHPYHGPDNNPQSRDQVARVPGLTQFLAEPMFSPMPEVTVAAAGRVFKAFGLRATHANQNPMLNTLVGFNGYNGAILWKRPLREGFMLDRNTMIATADTLYLADDESCKLIDARTGSIKDQIVVPAGVGDGKVWKWMALDTGAQGQATLYALVGGEEVKPKTEGSGDAALGSWAFPGWFYNNEKTNFGFGRTIMAIDLRTKEVLWKHDEQAYLDGRGFCMAGGRIYFYSPERFVGCLDAKTGKTLWKTSDADLLKAIGPSGAAWFVGDWGFATVSFLKCNNKYLFFSGPQRPNFVIASAADGKLLHQQRGGYLHLVLRDDAFYAVCQEFRTTAKTSSKMAYGTWETLANVPIRRGCTRPTASTDCIFYRAGEGTWQIRAADHQLTHVAPMRPPCPDGVIIANGMFYWGPWMCQCPLSLYGHIARAPAGKCDGPPGIDDARLEPGEGDTAAVEKLPIAQGDWPCYQGDNQRSAVTPIALAEKVSKLWEFQPPTSPRLSGEGSGVRAEPRPTAPVAAGDTVFVGDDGGVLRALDARSGKPKWEACTAGAIFQSPAVWEGRVYVGSADGRVYAFEAATGRRLWTFRAAPADRWIPVYGKLHSTWPVAGGIVVEDGVLYVAAGIANYDGTHVYALDAITGKVKWHNGSSGVLSNAGEGVSLQGELALRDGLLCFPGGTTCGTASYDLKTGECRSKVAKGQLTVFDAYYSQYGASYTELRHALPDGRRLVYAYDVRRGGNATDLTMLRALKANEAAPAKPVAGDVLWTCRARTFHSFIVGPNLLLAAGSDGSKKPVEHFVAAVKLADGADAWRENLPASAVRGGTAVDHAGRIFVALEDGRVVCLVTGR